MSKNLWIETDLEPDDVLAIDILRKKGYFLHTIVCGEGNVDRKIHRCMNYYGKQIYDENCDGDNLVTCGRWYCKDEKSCRFVKGFGSCKDFPEWHNDNTVNLYSTEYYDELKNYVKDNDTMVILKPPRELYELFCKNESDFSELLKNVNCYMYGSFNIRCINPDKKKMVEMFKSFKTFHLYESYAASGSDNNVNPSNYETFDNLQNVSNFFEVMHKWNDYIIKDCVDTCNELTKNSDKILKNFDDVKDLISENDHNRYKRNYKCYDQIQKTGGKQFVLADVGLAICIDKNMWTPVDVYFSEDGYTKFTKNSDSNVYTIIGIGASTLRQELSIIYDDYVSP